MNPTSVQSGSKIQFNGGDIFLMAIYLLMIIYTLYRLVKNSKIKSKMVRPYSRFRGKLKSSSIIVSAIVVFLGGVSLQQNVITGILMIVLALLLFFISWGEVLVGVEGIFGNNNYHSWNEVKRWYWDEDSSTLYLEVKERGKESVSYPIPCSPDDMYAINRTIRQYKLGK